MGKKTGFDRYSVVKLFMLVGCLGGMALATFGLVAASVFFDNEPLGLQLLAGLGTFTVTFIISLVLLVFVFKASPAKRN